MNSFLLPAKPTDPVSRADMHAVPSPRVLEVRNPFLAAPHAFQNVAQIARAAFRIEKRGEGRGKQGTGNVLMMSGGELGIPEEIYDSFLDRYAEDVIRLQGLPNNHLYLIEPRTPVYRFFMDFDMTGTEVAPDALVQKVMECVQRTVARYYAKYVGLRDHTTNLPILAAIRTEAPAKPKGDKRKRGVHLNWPNIFLVAEQALDIRANVIAEIERVCGKWEGGESWDTIVDAAVMDPRTKTGLRMLGSCKCERCPNRGKHLEPCFPLCINGSHVDPTYYDFVCVLDETGTPMAEETQALVTHSSLPFDVRVAHMKRLVRLTSIRAFGVSVPRPDFVRPANACPFAVAMSARKGGQPRLDGQRVLPRGSTMSDQIAAAVEKYLREKVRGVDHAYKDIHVRKVVRMAKAEIAYHVDVDGAGSGYCHNKRGTHSHSKIYFYIDKNGCQQRCYCTKSDGARNGMCCRQYRGDFIPLSSDVRAILQITDALVPVAAPPLNYGHPPECFNTRTWKWLHPMFSSLAQRLTNAMMPQWEADEKRGTPDGDAEDSAMGEVSRSTTIEPAHSLPGASTAEAEMGHSGRLDRFYFYDLDPPPPIPLPDVVRVEPILSMDGENTEW